MDRHLLPPAGSKASPKKLMTAMCPVVLMPITGSMKGTENVASVCFMPFIEARRRLRRSNGLPWRAPDQSSMPVAVIAAPRDAPSKASTEA